VLLLLLIRILATNRGVRLVNEEVSRGVGVTNQEVEILLELPLPLLFLMLLPCSFSLLSCKSAQLPPLMQIDLDLTDDHLECHVMRGRQTRDIFILLTVLLLLLLFLPELLKSHNVVGLLLIEETVDLLLDFALDLLFIDFEQLLMRARVSLSGHIAPQ
jgi:hypothetical protein